MDITIHQTFLPHTDPDASLAFYRDTLGFEVRNDVAFGGMRWLTVGPPAQPGTSIVLQPPAADPGASSYGMFVASSTDALVISNSSIAADNGAPGTNSAAPAAPTTPTSANGLVGSGAYTATCCVAAVSDTCMAGQPGQNA